MKLSDKTYRDVLNEMKDTVKISNDDLKKIIDSNIQQVDFNKIVTAETAVLLATNELYTRLKRKIECTKNIKYL